MPSPFRHLTNAVLYAQQYQGRILDIGGSKHSEYARALTRTSESVTVLNIDPTTSPDIIADIERPFPIADNSYDMVLAINVLEHVYAHRELLEEMRRVLVPGGEVVIVVPFCIQIHPSPNDFFRYTESALSRLLQETGFTVTDVRCMGGGVLTACTQLMYNFTPPIVGGFMRHAARFGDGLLTSIARMFHKTYHAEYYPLGYCIRAKKRS